MVLINDTQCGYCHYKQPSTMDRGHKQNVMEHIFMVGPLFIGSMERCRRGESDRMLNCCIKYFMVKLWG